MNYSISVEQISKRYQLGSGLTSLRDVLGNRNTKEENQYHWALRDVSFDLEPGESLGIIGPNGAGKTTILKILSRVTKQTSGEVAVNGRFSALIELGAGFHPDLTGRENVFLNGTILGMKRSEIRDRFDQIVEFSGIEEYLDTPVKRYSSGMYARLGFSIAAHVDPEILLVDEVLAVGDMGFRNKCYQRMLELIKKGTTLIFVSHDFGAVQRVCKRCIVVNRGQIAFDGQTGEAVAEFSNILRRTAARSVQSNGALGGGLSLDTMTHEAVIEEVKLVDQNGAPRLSFQSGEIARVQLRVRFVKDTLSPDFAFLIRSQDGQILYNYFTNWAKQPTPEFKSNTTAVIEFPLKLNLLSGTYHLGANLARSDLSYYYDRIDRAVDFVVTSRSGAQGVADLEASFHVVEQGRIVANTRI